MNKILRLLVLLALAAMAAGVPARVLAVITLTASEPATGLATSGGAGPGTRTMRVFINCTTPPCTILSTSGKIQYRDACGPPLVTCPSSPYGPNSQGVARIIKYDQGNIQKLELKGLQITDKDATTPHQRKVTLTLSANEYSTVQPGSYPWAVALSGNFTKKPLQSGGGGLTPSCAPPPYPAPALPLCARLRLRVNGNDVDTSRPDPNHRTVSIPCSNSSGYAHPCGPGGYYLTGSSGGAFAAMSMGALLFTTATSPVHLVDLADLNFTVADQTFQTMNSAILAMSTRTEVNFGVVNLFSHLAREFGQGDFWVYFSAAPQRDSAASYGDSAASHGDSVPSYPYLPPKEGVTLTSMAIDASRPPIGQVRRTRSYASFIADPSSLRWRDVKLLRLVYDFDVVTIGDLVFSDCARGSFYLLVDLVNKAGDEKKELPIYLGSSDGFKSGCERAARQLNGRNLVKNQDPRVAGGMTIRGSQHRYGYLYVRSISVVVDRGEGDSHANHRVRLYTAKVNGTWLAGLGASGDPYTAPEPVQIEVPSDLSPLKQ